MRKNVFTISLILFLALMGCNKINNQDKIIEIEKEFSFQPWQTLNEFGGGFSLITQTLKKQTCGGTKVDITALVDAQNISIKVKGLTYPAVCGNQPQFAMDTTQLSSLIKGTYNFKIILKDAVINEGSLRVDDNKYVLKMAKLDGIELPQTEIMRVPKGLIWGYLNYDMTQDSKSIKFTERIKKFATIQNDIPKGDYGYFVIGDQSSFNVKATINSKGSTKHLLYYLNTSNTELKNLVDEFRDPAFEIKFFTADGKVF
jgi:uncharacterized lipoprotein NlpE involved in copper resistance